MAKLTPYQKIGLGLVAGFVGTIVMTLGQTAEMKLTGRAPSKVPAQGAETLTGVNVAEPDEARLSNLVHWGFGTSLGAGLAAVDDLGEPARTLAFLAFAQGTGAAMLQALDLDGKPSGWDAKTASIDVAHHLVYAVTAALAYRGVEAVVQRRG